MVKCFDQHWQRHDVPPSEDGYHHPYLTIAVQPHVVGGILKELMDNRSHRRSRRAKRRVYRIVQFLMPEAQITVLGGKDVHMLEVYYTQT
jgi:hypothetical protein